MSSFENLLPSEVTDSSNGLPSIPISSSSSSTTTINTIAGTGGMASNIVVSPTTTTTTTTSSKKKTRNTSSGNGGNSGKEKITAEELQEQVERKLPESVAQSVQKFLSEMDRHCEDNSSRMSVRDVQKYIKNKLPAITSRCVSRFLYELNSNGLRNYPLGKRSKRRSTTGRTRKATARSSYFIFTAENRQEILAANPGLRATELAKVMGQKWRSLTEEQRKVYKDKYLIERAALEEKQAAESGHLNGNNNNGNNNNNNNNHSEDASTSTSRRNKKRKATTSSSSSTKSSREKSSKSSRRRSRSRSPSVSDSDSPKSSRSTKEKRHRHHRSHNSQVQETDFVPSNSETSIPLVPLS